MRKKGSEHRLDGILALLIFGVFAVCVLAVLLTGAGAYRRLTQRDAAAYDRRTVLQYVATRVRQNDSAGQVVVTVFDGQSCLELEDGDYVTRVYWYDGYVRELYAEAELEMDGDAGETVLEAEGLTFDLTDGVLTVTARTHGETETLTLALRSEQGVGA